MTAKEIKSEIEKALDNAPESVLEDVLNYLKIYTRIAGEDQSVQKKTLAQNIDMILCEDKTLLDRLAK
jgi:hypothetical protein